MEGLLFVRIPMVLVAGENVVDIGRIEPARVDLLAGRVAVRVVGKQVALPADPGRVDQIVDAAAMAATVEGLAGGVRRAWIGAEVVIEGHILLEDHHQMLDRRRGRRDHYGGGESWHGERSFQVSPSGASWRPQVWDTRVRTL